MSQSIRIGGGGSNSGFTAQDVLTQCLSLLHMGCAHRGNPFGENEGGNSATVSRLVTLVVESNVYALNSPNTDLTDTVEEWCGLRLTTRLTAMTSSGNRSLMQYSIDSNAKTIRDKAWPLWEQWTVVFGKDRAIGTTAEDIADGARASQQQANVVDSEDYSNDYFVQMDDILPEDNTPPQQNTPPENFEESTGHSASILQNNNKGGKKRKTHSSDELLMDFLGNLHAETNSRLEMIASRIGYEFDLGKKHLKNLTQRLDIFMGMPEESRLGYVLRFVNQN
ncbi:hypothetical protein SASPL_104964 [Salvia splendens]|uniref:Uncharacterized protein n=1 Tax=Salvia splendens TaxID=180675 RepID=A0A8X8YK87_SALSN|nr:hypothetical protein SASPL_104964 [Salvia splendens]